MGIFDIFKGSEKNNKVENADIQGDDKIPDSIKKVNDQSSLDMSKFRFVKIDFTKESFMKYINELNDKFYSEELFVESLVFGMKNSNVANDTSMLPLVLDFFEKSNLSDVVVKKFFDSMILSLIQASAYEDDQLFFHETIIAFFAYFHKRDPQHLLSFTENQLIKFDYFSDFSLSEVQRLAPYYSEMNGDKVYNAYSSMYMDKSNRGRLNDIFLRLFVLFSHSSFDNLIKVSSAIGSYKKFNLSSNLIALASKVYTLNQEYGGSVSADVSSGHSGRDKNNYYEGVDTFFIKRIKEDFNMNVLKYIDGDSASTSSLLTSISYFTFLGEDCGLSIRSFDKIIDVNSENDDVIFAILENISPHRKYKILSRTFYKIIKHKTNIKSRGLISKIRGQIKNK